MPRRRSFVITLLVLAVVGLPVFAAAIRARPMGNYKFNLNGTTTYKGSTINDRDRGTFRLSGKRIAGQTNDGEVRFNLKFNSRINATSPQKRTAAGGLNIDDEDFGTNRGRISANVRVQQTRNGRWKTTVNYSAKITRGQAKGALLTGKMVGKSI